MASKIATILPRVIAVLKANMSSTYRTVNVPTEYPDNLSSADLPCFMVSLSGINKVSDDETSTSYSVTITIQLMHSVVGSKIKVANQYDIAEHFDALEELIRTNPYLENNDNGLDGVYDAIELSPQIQLPTIVRWNTTEYNGFVARINIPFQKTTL